MSELSEYKRQMAATNATHAASWAADREQIVELEATVARLREENERLRGCERLWNETCLLTAHHGKTVGGTDQ